MADSPELSAALTESLRQSPLLRDLSAAQVRAVIGAARLRQVARDGFLFQQGDLASALHLLLAGRLRILQVTPEGQQVLLRVVTPGEVCGGIGLLEDATRWPVWAAHHVALRNRVQRHRSLQHRPAALRLRVAQAIESPETNL